MSAETELFAALSAAPAVTAIVSTRIYPDAVPQEQMVPSIAYARTDTEFVTTIHDGTPVGQFATLEVVCMAEARDIADAIADAALAALGAAGFFVQTRAQDFDSEKQLWGTVVSVRRFTT